MLAGRSVACLQPVLIASDRFTKPSPANSFRIPHKSHNSTKNYFMPQVRSQISLIPLFLQRIRKGWISLPHSVQARRQKGLMSKPAVGCRPSNVLRPTPSFVCGARGRAPSLEERPLCRPQRRDVWCLRTRSVASAALFSHKGHKGVGNLSRAQFGIGYWHWQHFHIGNISATGI